MLLKLVGTPTEMLVERFKIMWPEGGVAQLTTVMSLKAMKKTEQQHLIDIFGGDAPPAPQQRNFSQPAATNADPNLDPTSLPVQAPAPLSYSLE